MNNITSIIDTVTLLGQCYPIIENVTLIMDNVTLL